MTCIFFILTLLNSRFLDIPAQLTYCKLDLVRPDPATGIWTNESKCFFKKLVSDARVTAFVQGKVIGRVGRALIKELALFVILYVTYLRNYLNFSFFLK